MKKCPCGPPSIKSGGYARTLLIKRLAGSVMLMLTRSCQETIIVFVA
jgi:hypothetical protein